jgi:hypothetical protein
LLYYIELASSSKESYVATLASRELNLPKSWHDEESKLLVIVSFKTTGT